MIHFGVKIHNIFELIIDIIIMRSIPQGVIKCLVYLQGIIFKSHMQCVWATMVSVMKTKLRNFYRISKEFSNMQL